MSPASTSTYVYLLILLFPILLFAIATIKTIPALTFLANFASVAYNLIIDDIATTDAIFNISATDTMPVIEAIPTFSTGPTIPDIATVTKYIYNWPLQLISQDY